MHSSIPILTSRTFLCALALACGAPSLGAGGIVVFEGPAGALGDVRSYDELSGAPLSAPTELQGIQLLPIEFAGRTRLQELLPGRPRLRNDVAGASRLALAGQRGSLYHFSRGLPTGGASFGYFRIAADGSVIVLFELPGTGPLGTQDPFLRRVALSPTSTALLAATTLPSGGNLYEIDLANGSALDRSAALPPQRFSPAGLALTNAIGVAACASGILRFDRGQAGDASFVPFAPAQPTWFSGQLVSSQNGQWFLSSAGSDVANQFPFAFDATGSAIAVSQQPARISIAGYEPDVSDGPYMAIRDDGQQAAWRIELGPTREILLANVQPQPGQVPELLSSNANFLDTLDEIGLAIFKPGGALHVAIGRSPGGLGNAIESFDTYLVTLPATSGPASFTNLSLFSGVATAPFLVAPQVKAKDWVLLPDQSTLLVYDSLPPDGVLDAIRPSTPGAQPVLGFIKSLDSIECAGRWIVADLRRSDGNNPQELWRIPIGLGQPAARLASLPAGTNYSRFAPRRDGWLAFVSLEPSGTETLQRAHLPSGTLQVWNPATIDLGAALGYTSLGTLALSVDNPVSCATWPFGSQPPVTLQSTSGPCQILPGI